jgi:DUF4097 and DUF4098 domain-containing protein YvlB
MRTLLVLPCLAAILSAAPAFDRTETRTEALPMGSKLWVRQVDGKVDVQGWDRPEVELVAEYRDGSRGERATLELRRVKEGLEMEVKVPRHRHFFLFGSHRGPLCNLTLKVPRRLSMAVRTVDGDISVRDLEGYARCETVDGDIRLEQLAGEAYTRAVDGDITARHLKARIKGSAVDGRITLEDVQGGIDLHTVDGRIEASGLDGWGEGILLRTVDGAIHVKLGGARGELDAHTVDGSIHAQVPGMELVETRHNTLKARIPGRTQAIRLRTTDGNIQVE